MAMAAMAARATLAWPMISAEAQVALTSTGQDQETGSTTEPRVNRTETRVTMTSTDLTAATERADAVGAPGGTRAADAAPHGVAEHARSTPSSIVIRTSTLEPAARCVVCGNEIAAGEGLTARYGERTLRFKCPGCLARFESDPERYLAGDPGGCCGGHHTGGEHGGEGGTKQ